VALSELDRRAGFDHLTSVFVPNLGPLAATRSIQGLRAVIRRLRAPDGCPWDREQTHESIRRYVLEEAYEVAEAIDDGDPVELKEELGDLLLQVVLHAQIADDEGTFDLDDVVQRLNEKLIGRHPHVFGDVRADTSADVVRNWEALKRAEKGESTVAKSALDGVPRTMPALRAAQEVLQRAQEAGLPWSPTAQDWEAAEATVRGLRGDGLATPTAGDVGHLLLMLARRATELDLDAESALVAATQRYGVSFREAEKAARGPASSSDTRSDPG
jgi:tetrapyrrole methylase family protein/MazG family protein